jgi:hypothetical protein
MLGEKVKVNLEFNPQLSGSIEAVVTTQSDKKCDYYMSEYAMLMFGSKPHIKSIDIVNKYPAGNAAGVSIYKEYYMLDQDNKRNKRNK